ncbi:hypothetical protein DPMN_020165 [Dreissena polymorpha]|uniref:Uncharacterized protein n=1 Tax=Dreissena polymorpha TaxID=45954 RepID=A0A9D4S9Y7_DREPO|nr:hypothetical protein DPMN_020165 [Dreissena polymorpha]
MSGQIVSRRDGGTKGSKVGLSRRDRDAQNIIGTNLLTKFHKDWKINVASRVLTRTNAPTPGSHVFQPAGIISEPVQDIIGINLLSKFHDDRTINVASRVLTRFYYSHIRKNALPLGSHFFQANVTILKLIQDIIETNFLTKFHEDWTINLASRELTRQMFTLHNAQRTTDDGQKAITKAHHEHVVLSCELIKYIIVINGLAMFHEDWVINDTYTVFPR